MNCARTLKSTAKTAAAKERISTFGDGLESCYQELMSLRLVDPSHEGTLCFYVLPFHPTLLFYYRSFHRLKLHNIFTSDPLKNE